jgi:putative FmdB family regulatory protein
VPTYQYKCQACGHEFEEFQRITAEPLTACPEDCCQGLVKRLIGAGGGLLFKGSGFYITDYRSEGYKKSAKADADSTQSGTDSKSSGSDTSGSKTDPKPSGACSQKD